MQTTLTIIKPDAVAAGNTGNILALLEKEGFLIRGMKFCRLTQEQAGAFYEVHKERPFYGELVKFMTSGPVAAVALQRDDAVLHLRKVMGATDSEKAEKGTVRNLYGTNIERNAIHGSDSEENAEKEVCFFFCRSEVVSTRWPSGRGNG